jgi:hypothetical protein
MEDVNVFNDLRQLSHGHVKALKLEVSHPFAATTNSRIVTSGKDATDHVTDYYGILQNIIEHTFGGAKVLKVVFFQCDCFDLINGTRVDDFGMVEVKHESRYFWSNLLPAHQAQQVYYLSYPHPS